MSRRRTKNKPQQQQNPHQKPKQAEKSNLKVDISLLADFRVEVDTFANSAAMEYLDALYDDANREDYDPSWTNDHKIAYWVADMMDQFLSQWDIEPSPEEQDGGMAPQVPHIREGNVDRFDLADAEAARSEGVITNA